MSQATAHASGLVRVTVASRTRRVDLLLPGSVPVAELLPELARSVGLLDSATVYGGYRVVTQDGRLLSGDAGLTLQGVEDGTLLTVAAGAEGELPRVYDDVVEAMADVVERDLKPWDPASGRRTALTAAGLLMALGAVAILVLQQQTFAGVAAALVAAALLTGAVVLSRAQGETEAAVALAWTACGYAAVAGFVLAPARDGLPLGYAAAAACATGLLALVGLEDGRPLLLPPVVVGALFLPVGMLLGPTDLDPAVVLTCALVVVVLVGSVLPWLALSVTGTNVDQLYSDADITGDPEEIDPARVGGDARLAHQILMAITATIGLLLVLVAPLAVSRGLSGTLIVIVASLVMMLRTRQYRAGAEVRIGLCAGVAGLLATAVSVLLQHPDWRPAAAVVLTVAGAVLLGATLLPSTQSVRRGRLADLAETLCLLALLPLLVIASGLFASIRG